MLVCFFYKNIRLFAFAILALTSLTAVGQVASYSDGTVVRHNRYVDVNGSPYFFADWKNGDVIFTDSTRIENIRLLYDEINNEVLYEGKGGDKYSFNKPLDRFVLYGTDKDQYVFKRNLKITGLNETTYYEVLYLGKVKLFKRNSKLVVERIVYGSANVNKLVQDNVHYYLVVGPHANDIKLNDKGVYDLIDRGQADALRKYASENKLKIKDEDQFIRLLKYYETM